MADYKLLLAGGSAENTRVSAVNANDSSSGYVGIGIVGIMIVGKTIGVNTKDSRYINCFIATVPNNVTGRKKVYVVKRPGFGAFSTPEAGSKGMAILVWTGQGSKVISAFGDTNSTIYDGTTGLGAMTGYATGLTETFVSTQATVVASSSDSTAWYYDTSAGVTTQITDAQFPGNAGYTLAGTFAHMAGFACIMTTDGKLWASDVNSVTAWTANSFDSAQSYPDLGIGAIRWKNFIITFGTESMQFWTNAGLSPFPLSCSNAMTQKVGCVAAKAITSVADTVFWCGSTDKGGLSIFRFDGTLHRMSPPEIDASLILAGSANISLSAIRFYGRSFVLVKAGTTTFAYCIEEQMWGEWNSTTPLWTACSADSASGTMLNYAVSNVSTTGKVFSMNHASLVFTDDSVAYTATIQLPNEDHGTAHNKFYDNMEIVGDVESSASTLTVSCSDDDYQTTKVLGTVDLSAQRRFISRLGKAKKRSWIFTHAAATPMRLERAEGSLTIGR